MTATPSFSFTVPLTPGSFLMASSFQLSGVPPWTGECTVEAYTMPGRWTSMEYLAVPFTFGGVSRRGTALPIRRNALSFLSALSSTLGRVLGGLAKAAISP